MEPNSERSKTGRFCRDNKIPDALRPLMIIFQAAATSFASAGANVLFKEFGFNVDNVVETAKKVLK